MFELKYKNIDKYIQLSQKGEFLILLAGSLSHNCCRESIHRLSLMQNPKFEHMMGFYNKGLDIKKARQCFKLIENKIKLTGKNKIKIQETNVENCVVFEIPPFWSENVGRFELFTLFLRFAFCYYRGGSLKNNYKNYDLICQTSRAVDEFLSGKIYFSQEVLKYFIPEESKGWVYVFNNNLCKGDLTNEKC